MIQKIETNILLFRKNNCANELPDNGLNALKERK
jgi:hypothetical protein